MEKFEALEKAMCHELEKIAQKLDGGTEMSTADLDKIDKLTHAMKSLATYEAMRNPEEWEDGMSGRRNPVYADGYSMGYAEGSRHGGHWPMMPERYRY